MLKVLLVTGGIPRYSEEIDPRHTAEANIKRLCFSPAGLLFNEYDHVNGVTEGIEEADYFDKVVDFGALVT